MFSVNEQEFYIKEIKPNADGTGPHFPVRCPKCRYNKKPRNGDIAAIPPTVLAAGVDPIVDTDPDLNGTQAAPTNHADLVVDNWDEVLRFADGEDFKI